MSQYPQYPPPYTPPQPGSPQPGYYAPYPPPSQSPDDLLRPARRAGVLMIVLGVLFVLFGLCMAGMSWLITHPEFQAQPGYADIQQRLQEVEAQSGMSVQTALLITGAIPLALGALLGGLGFGVRGGGLVPVTLGIVLAALLLLLIGIVLLAGLVQGGGNPLELVGALCIYGIPFALLVLLMVWLIQAARNATRLATARQQQQVQMWQYQQHQQAYLQQPPPGQPQAGGMGYHYPPHQPPTPAPQSGAPPQGGAEPQTPAYYVTPPAPPADAPTGAAAERKDPPDAPPAQG